MEKLKLIFLVCLVLYVNNVLSQNFSHIHQSDGVASNAYVKQNGDNNLLMGIPEHETAAYQNSQNTGINDINVEQINSTFGINSIFLYQSAAENNIANFTQKNGINTIMLSETSTAGSNETHITQLNGINFANIERSAYLNNTIPSSANTKMFNPSGYDGIYQEGWGNSITGASEVNIPFIGSTVIPRLDQPAQQISTGGSNWLEIWQTGGANLVGLYQEAWADNTALINQQNGGNTALIFQKNMTGSNYLELEQMGNSSAVIYQSTISGSYNRAIVTQN